MTTRRMLGGGVSLLLVGAVLVGGGGVDVAQALLPCTFTQLTDEAESETVDDPSISADGTRIAFSSSADIGGGNPDGSSEVYLYDTTSSTTEAMSDGDGGSYDPSISGDGSHVAFVSTSDLVDENPDENEEVFLVDVTSSTITQVTDSTDDHSFGPSLSADGSRLAFGSSADLAEDNADGNEEVFLFDTGTSTIQQITHTTGALDGIYHRDPSVSGDGNLVAFPTSADIGGGNPEHNVEMYLYDDTDETTRQVTSTTVGTSFSPSISADGSHLAFGSSGDLTGENPGEGQQVFVYDIEGETTVQVTGPGGGSNAPRSVSADGDRVAFASDGDPTGENPDASYEVFVADVEAETTFQITEATEQFSFAPVLSGDGRTVAFESSEDLAGENADGSDEVFLASCTDPAGVAFTDVSPSHPFFADIAWMAAEGISLGYQPGPTYRPGVAVSRQAMSAFMYRLAGEPAFTPPPSPTFGDVSSSNDFFLEIEWMASEGITTGTAASPKPLYKPSSPVSRGAMAAFMYRLAGSPPFTPTGTTFGDVSTGHQFYAAIEWMAAEHISNGTAASPKPLYKPAAPVSRGAMSAFMHRLSDGPGVGV